MSTPTRTPKRPENIALPTPAPTLASCTGAVLTISVRRGTPADIEARYEAALAYIGIPLGTLGPETVDLPYSFTDIETGDNPALTTRDALTLIAALRALALAGWESSVAAAGSEEARTDEFDAPPVVRVARISGFGTTVDAEDRETDLFMIPVAHHTDEHRGTFNEFFRCAEAADATWPRLFEILGASVSGSAFASATGVTTVRINESFATPELLRLKSGWDIDGAGNQIWLPLEEAWRRFSAANDRLPARRQLSKKDLSKIRALMEAHYADVPPGGTHKPPVG